MSANARYVTLSGGHVRVRSPYSLSAKMDVVFDRHCSICVLPTYEQKFKAKIICDFAFLDGATADIDDVMDAAVIVVGQEDTIKYTVKKTGLVFCRLSMACQCLMFLCMCCEFVLGVCVSKISVILM